MNTVKLRRSTFIKAVSTGRSWFIHRSLSLLCTEPIPFPFSNHAFLKVLSYISFSYFFASFLSLSLFNTYLIANKTINQTHCTFSQFCISVVPKGFYLYNIYCWATFIHLILPLYIQLSTAFFLWDCDGKLEFIILK